MAKTPEIEEIVADAHSLITSRQSLLMSSIDETGAPHLSYAPYICAASNEESIKKTKKMFYVFVSALAKHQQTLAQGVASVMLISDEADSPNIFARKRVTFNCHTRVVTRDSEHGQKVLAAMRKRHGKTVELLQSLPDFTLFALEPRDAWYVSGFGAAIDLSPQIEMLLAD